MGQRANTRGGAFPQAPTQEEWERMGPEEQARVVEALPGEVTYEEMAMPEGDRHSRAKLRVKDALEGYFRHQRRKVYVGMELPVYYPAERRFAPDLLVVLEAENHERDKWMVSYEGKGLDWVMEVHVGGDRKKDAEFNVERYARVGIPEYFIYDRSREELLVYRLPDPTARKYERQQPRHGRYESRVLGLEFELVDDTLRLWAGNALLLESAELLERVQESLEKVQRRVEHEARQREALELRLAEEARLRAEEARLRAEAEQRLAELQSQLERLQRTGK
ncbi:MAG TPA: Uma2 family endonuclease [Myxococcaceae bacterium]|jgi:Uma2 family endonuclease